MPRIGFKHSEESRAKMRASQHLLSLGRHHSDVARAKMRAARLGVQLSSETRSRMSSGWHASQKSIAHLAEITAGNRGRKRGPLSEFHRARLVAANIGRIHSTQDRANNGAAQRASLKQQAHLVALAGAARGRPGRKLTAEIRAKIGAKATGRPKSAEERAAISARTSGANNPNWLGGTSEDTRGGSSYELNRWKRTVHRRDENVCQWCNKATDPGRDRVADHIIAWREAPELRYEIWNGRTLCRDCDRVRTSAQMSRFRREPKLSH